MGRNGWRVGLAQVNVVVDPVLRDRLRAKARRNKRSLSEESRLAWLAWLGDEVSGDGDAGAGAGDGCAVEADGSGRGYDYERFGSGDVGVVAVPVSGSLTGFVNVSGNPKLDALNAAVERVMVEKAVLRSVPEPVEDVWVDPADGAA